MALGLAMRKGKLWELDPEQRIRALSVVDVETECWNWIGSTWPNPKKPYGRVQVNYSGGPRIQAHRYSYEVFKEPIPPGMLVCHRCDNHRCVNPEHLFLGTAKDNTRDAMRKGRIVFPPHVPGDKHPQRKVTAEQVVAIRADTRVSWRVALDYNISGRQVRAIRNHEAWKAVA